jgi:hypothetical protein
MGFILFKMASRWNDDLDELMWITGWISWTLIKQNPNPHIHKPKPIMTYPFDDCWRFKFICWTTSFFSSLGANEQDEIISSMGWSEQCSQSPKHWSNRTWIPTSINTNPSMHNHLPINHVPLGQSSFCPHGNMIFIRVCSKW